MDDTISRQAVINEYGDWYVEEGTEDGFIGTVKQLLEGFPSAQPAQDDEAAFWKERAREYEDMIIDLVAKQAKGIKVDLIQITEEGIIFKKSQPERKRGRWKLQKNGNAICSECGFVQVSAWDADGWDNFCHHCGADMRGGEQ